MLPWPLAEWARPCIGQVVFFRMMASDALMALSFRLPGRHSTKRMGHPLQILRMKLQGLFLVAPGFFQPKVALFSYRPFHFVSRLFARLMKRMLPSILQSSHLNPDANLPAAVENVFVSSWQTFYSTAVLEEMIMAWEPPYVEVLADLPPTVPLHIVWSEQDTANPYAATEVQQYFETLQMKQKVPPFSHSLFAGSGHYIQHGQAEQLAQELVSFVSRSACNPPIS